MPPQPIDRGQCVVHTNTIREVPKSQHTPAYKLFHYRYACLVQQMFTSDLNAARAVGLVTTGDDKLDREQRQAWVNIYPTPWEMLEYLDRGAALEFSDFGKTAELYYAVTQHLADWYEAVRSDPMRRTVPLDDLRRFDELAAMLFRFTWPQEKTPLNVSGLSHFLAGRRKLRGSMRMVGLPERLPANSRGVTPRYRPYSQEIAEILDSRERGLMR